MIILTKLNLLSLSPSLCVYFCFTCFWYFRTTKKCCFALSLRNSLSRLLIISLFVRNRHNCAEVEVSIYPIWERPQYESRPKLIEPQGKRRSLVVRKWLIFFIIASFSFMNGSFEIQSKVSGQQIHRSHTKNNQSTKYILAVKIHFICINRAAHIIFSNIFESFLRLSQWQNFNLCTKVSILWLLKSLVKLKNEN